MNKSCKLIDLSTFSGADGSLTFIENQQLIPFDIKRVYYLHGVPANTQRGVHAHKTLQQLIIAVSGSFDITIDDGESRTVFHMNNPQQGLYVCPMIWREIDNFSSDAVLMVLASTVYEPDDYIHEYHEFITYKKAATHS